MPQAPSAQAWRPAKRSSQALEPIDLPPAIEQGVDMIYIDQSLIPQTARNGGFLAGISDAAWSAAPVDLFTSVNPIYTDLLSSTVGSEAWNSRDLKSRPH